MVDLVITNHLSFMRDPHRIDVTLSRAKLDMWMVECVKTAKGAQVQRQYRDRVMRLITRSLTGTQTAEIKPYTELLQGLMQGEE